MPTHASPARRARLAASAALVLASLGAAHAATIVADSDGGCSLTKAIQSANGNANVAGCSASGAYGTDTIQLDYDVVLTTPFAGPPPTFGGPAGLPNITSPMTIAARAGDEIARSSGLGCASNQAAQGDAFRFFNVVAGGNLSLVGVTLRNGCIAPATGGAHGGAILVSGGTLALDGATLAGNVARGPDGTGPTERYALGGAIIVPTGTIASIHLTTFDGNLARGGDNADDGAGSAEGGAIAGYGSAVIGTITSSDFVDNHAQGGDATAGSGAGGTGFGGAISFFQSSSIGTIDRVIFTGNEALGGNSTGGAGAMAQGGALHLVQTNVTTIARSSFRQNAATSGSGATAPGGAYGGAVANTFGSSIGSLRANTFAANEAATGTGPTNPNAYGGALYNEETIALAENNSWIDNVATSPSTNLPILRGGAIWSFGPLTTFRHNTIAGNQLVPVSTTFFNFVAGAGLWVDSLSSAFSNNLVADNVQVRQGDTLVADDCHDESGGPSSGTYNLVETPGGCSFTAASNIIGVDPALDPAADNGCLAPLADGTCPQTITLPVNSAALDFGSCATSGATEDERGIKRPKDFPGVTGPDDECDIGAIEMGEEVDLQLVVGESADPVAFGATSLTYTVTLTNSEPLVATATNVAVAVALTLPADVTVSNVTPSSGTWNGSTWTVPSLAPATPATLTIALAIGPNAPTGTDNVTAAATVTAVDQEERDPTLPSDSESTSILGRSIFASGFEPSDPHFDYEP